MVRTGLPRMPLQDPFGASAGSPCNGSRRYPRAATAPDLAHTVNPEVLLEHAPDFDLQNSITLGPGRELGRIMPLGQVIVIGRRGDRQHLADRLDPIGDTMIIDEGDHGLNRRSSSAWAKYADALRNISLACRSSRFSRSRAFSRSATSLGMPTRAPLSTSAFFTHSCRVWAVHPIFAAIEETAAHRDACSPS